MKKKPYAVMAFVIAYIIYALLTSCSAESIATLNDQEILDMENVIAQKEAELDSLDNIMPLSDTVGETDTYCDMLEARDAFNYSRSIDKKREHYHDYLWLHHCVVEAAEEWMNENKTQDN